MLFEFNLYSSLLLIFFTQLLVFALLIFVNGIKENRLSSKLLAAFLFISALFIFPWMSGFAGWYDNQPYRELLFYTPFIQGLFIGPLLYLYVKSLLNANYRPSLQDYLHFLPGCLYVLWAIIVVIIDKVILHKYFLMDGANDPDFDRWYAWLWSASVLIYLFLTLKYYRQYRAYIYFELSFAESAGLKWLRNFLVACLLLTIVLVADQLSAVFTHPTYVISWYYFMGFAFISYYIAISAHGQEHRVLQKLHFTPDALAKYQHDNNQPTPVNPETSDPKPDDGAVERWKPALLKMFDVEKVYLDPELTLTELAKKINTNASLLSKVINAGFGMPFNDLVNNYRVNEAKLLMASRQYKDLTLLSIAFDAGFNSKATFNRAFKKTTGVTPKTFQKTIISGHLNP